jgi:hypothetical protein
MTELYVDSVFLACPQQPAQASDYAAYVNALAELQATHSYDFVRLLIPANAIETLERAGALPPWERSEIDLYVQREEVSRLLFGLLGKSRTIEDEFGIKDLLVDDMGCEPSSHLADRRQVFVDDYHRTLAFVSLGKRLRPGGSPTVLTKGISVVTSVTVYGEIIEINPDDSGIPLPFAYRELITHLSKISELSTVLSALDLWQRGFLLQAINLVVCLRRNDPRETWPEVHYDYSLGKSFTESVRSLGFDRDPTRVRMLLRACANTILEEDLRDTHPLRTGTSGNAPQQVRQNDNATAWRRDVDHEHHLHYWKVANHVELAAVVPHNDFDIRE